MKRVYHHYETWEDYKMGMYDFVKFNENDAIQKTIKFMENTAAFSKAMNRVINEWPISCEQNLTNSGANNISWLGQAAVCIELGIPEFITRRAWKYLLSDLQKAANKEAKKYITEWIANYNKRNPDNPNQLDMFA